MALNIPVNLMNTAAPPIQSSATSDAANSTNTVTTIQPTSSSASTCDTGAEGGGMNRESAQQKALMIQQRVTLRLPAAPDKAEPKSVVAAQADRAKPEQPIEKAETLTKTPDGLRQSELDRYAPPNPLPTAPILQLAASYAALTKQEN